MTRKRANSSAEYRNLHMLSSVKLLSSVLLLLLQQEYNFHPQEIKKLRGLVLAAVRCALLQAHSWLIFHCRNSGKSNRLVPQKNTDQNDFYTERKAKKQAFQRCLWKLLRCMFRYGLLNSAYFKDFIEESAWKFRRFFFCGVFNRRKYT